MRTDLEQKLTERIHCELRQLPLVKAPTTLLPRVLAAIEAARANQPWWRKSWSDWPKWCRVLVLFAGLCVAGGMGYLAFSFGPDLTLSALGDVAAEWLSPLRPAWEALAALANAALVLVRAGGQLLLWVCLLVVAVIYLTSVGLGTVCYRMALNRI
jgi:hypothetical protein